MSATAMFEGLHTGDILVLSKDLVFYMVLVFKQFKNIKCCHA